VADLVGVPKWLAEVLPTAYPNRSVEAWFDVSTSTGKQHRMIITSVALLGENLPGVQTLDDLEYLFSDEPTEWITALTAETKVAASQFPTGGDPMPMRVAASVDTSDVRSAFYEQVATEDSVAEDESMGYWVVPYTTTSTGIEFDEPVEAQIQWVNKDNGNVMASAINAVAAPKFGHASQTWTSAEASRPGARQAEYKKKEAKGSMPIDIPALRGALGLSETDLPDDATEEQINAAIISRTDPTPEPEEDPDEDVEPDEDEAEDDEPAAVAASGNVVTVDKTVWEQTRKGAQAGLAIQAENRRAANESFLDSAIRKGKIAPVTRASYLAQMNGPKNDGEGPAKTSIEKLINDLPSGVLPIDEIGHSEGETNKASSQGTGLFPKLEARRAAREG
jgi:hypothetical protein